MIQRTWRHSLSGAGLCLLAACGGDGEGGAPAGGSGALDGPDFTIAPAYESRWIAGSMDGEDWEIFGSIADLVFNEAGDLFILDEQAGHIVVLDRDGTYLRTISRQGEGPGELTDPESISLLADGRLAVFDGGRSGIQFVTPEGAYAESAPFDPTQGAPTGVGAWLSDGSIITNREFVVSGTAESMSVSSSVGGTGDEPGRPIARYRPEGTRELLYTAWEPPPPTGDAAEAGGGSFSFNLSPVRAFDPGLHFAALSDGRLAVVDSSGYRIKLIGEDGIVGEILERPLSPIPVTSAVRDAERERRLAELEGSGDATTLSISGRPDIRMPDDFASQLREAFQARIERMTFAEVVPAIDALAVDFEDRLWVARTPLPDEEGPIDIVTPDARYLGTIQPGGLRIPDAFGPDGLIAYVDTHDLGYPIVRVVQLAPDAQLRTEHPTP
ncbi:MAG: hypothetical protein F4Z72_07790 [Gemmatimonadales bacterium]|nr:hypothetical protein [Candidatus Palauibacter irciniicola]MYC17393.1 hypothetical protein [Gemmatimonadales bacterium]